LRSGSQEGAQRGFGPVLRQAGEGKTVAEKSNL